MTQADLEGFLEKAADTLRGNVDHSEFRGYVFALLFFKRISDLFQEAIRKLAKDLGEELAHDPLMQKRSLPFIVPADSLWEVVTYGTKEKPITSITLGQSLRIPNLHLTRRDRRCAALRLARTIRRSAESRVRISSYLRHRRESHSQARSPRRTPRPRLDNLDRISTRARRASRKRRRSAAL
jgi:hypothetical protein